MALLIDGYNLLHVTAIVGRRSGLHGSRQGLLRFLAATIDPLERPRTTIVFDAAEAPPGLPRSMVHEEIAVRFSSGYGDADELIEELILAHAAPRTLLVVSSDHRLQRAARRRRAAYVDSDVWFAEALRQVQHNRRPVAPAAKPTGTLTADEVAYWLAEFGDADDAEREGSVAPKRHEQRGQAAKRQTDDLSNPFPPGYGEDLLTGE